MIAGPGPSAGAGPAAGPGLVAGPPSIEDVETAPLDDLEAEICSWAGRIAAATCRMLVLLAAFDRRKGWSGLGMASCAHWLAWRCGLSVRTAQEHLAVARALEGLPAVRGAFAAGQLSYSKVRAVTRVAEAETEQSWLNHALHCTASQLERLASRYRSLTTRPTAQREARRLTWRTNSEGLFRLSAVLTAEEGARLTAVVDAARASLDDVSPPPSETDPGTAPADGEILALPRDRRADADALLALVDGFLSRPAPGLMRADHTLTVHLDADALLAAHGQTAANIAAPSDQRSDSPGSADPPAPLKAGERSSDGHVENGLAAPTAQADLVHRLAQGLLRHDAGPGTGLSMPALARLGCDALVRALLRDENGNPLALGRRRRIPTRRLRDAVHARDQGTCQYPGCAHTRWLQIHHLREWLADEGTTDLENLTLLCSRHHTLIHDEGIRLRRRASGAIEAVMPDGFVLIPAPHLDPGAEPAERLADSTGHVTADAVHTRDGGRLSWDDSLYLLMRHRVPPDDPPTGSRAA